MKVSLFCVISFLSISVRSSSWSQLADLPQMKWENGGAVLNGLIYSVGGSDQINNDWSSVFAYNLKTNTWSTVAPLTLPRRNHGTSVSMGFIYVCGGYYGESTLNTAAKYDPSKNEWTQIANLSVARQGLTASTGSDNQVYAIGGNPSGNLLEIYNPHLNKWSIGTPLNIARSGHASVSSLDGDFIYVFGGYNDNLGYLTSLEVYSLATRQWTALAPLSVARFAPAGAVDSTGLIYALGGEGVVPCDGSVETYNKETNKWFSSVPNMKYPRAEFGAVCGSDGRIYVFGGQCNYPVLNATEALTITNENILVEKMFD